MPDPAFGSGTSLIKNNKGPKMKPCGTSTSIFSLVAAYPSKLTNCLPVSFHLSIILTVQTISLFYCNVLIYPAKSLSRQSKAQLRYNSTTQTAFYVYQMKIENSGKAKVVK